MNKLFKFLFKYFHGRMSLFNKQNGILLMDAAAADAPRDALLQIKPILILISQNICGIDVFSHFFNPPGCFSVLVLSDDPPSRRSHVHQPFPK